MDVYEVIKAGANTATARTEGGVYIRGSWQGTIIRITVHLPAEQLPRRQTYEG